MPLFFLSPSALSFATRVQNIKASHILDFEPYHILKSYSCCYVAASFRQKTDSTISKNNSSLKPGFSLEKIWKKLSILSLLLIIHLFIYPAIYIFYLSVYFTILPVEGDSYQRVLACLNEGYS